jgi:hypothetical protein
MQNLNQGRYNAPLAFIQERFVCALGGLTTNKVPTLTCEGYDVVKNQCFRMMPLEKPRYSTSAVVMQNHAIYIMPGNCGGGGASGSVQLFMLDLKPAGKFNKDDMKYVKAIATQKWVSL